MNSSKFRGPAGFAGRAETSSARAAGTVLSATPSPQQSVTAASFGSVEGERAQATRFFTPFPFADGLPLPSACDAAAGFGSGFAFNPPNRASIAPTMHSLITSAGSPYSDPWNG